MQELGELHLMCTEVNKERFLETAAPKLRLEPLAWKEGESLQERIFLLERRAEMRYSLRVVVGL